MNAKSVMLKGSARPRQTDATRIGDIDPSSRVELTLSLKAPALPDPGQMPAQAISRDQLASDYGAKQEDADKVASVLKSYGIRVDEISLLTRSMRVSGTADAMEKAFQANLGLYHNASQGDFRGREGTLRIPAPLAGIVTGIFGLDERQVAHRKALRSVAAAPGPALAPLTPADLENRYNFPPGAAAGQQIAIAEFDGGYFAEDLQAFCTKYSL